MEKIKSGKMFQFLGDMNFYVVVDVSDDIITYKDLYSKEDKLFKFSLKIEEPSSIIWGETVNKEDGLLLNAVKFDKNKIKMELLPPKSLENIAEVFTFGAEKYEPWNFLKGDGLETSRVYGSLQRHLNSYYQGEELDSESGLSHLAHAGANLMMLLELERKKVKAGQKINSSYPGYLEQYKK